MKKKPKGKTQQQIRQEQVHQKRLYLQKIRSVMGIIGSESAFDLLSPSEVDTLYLARLRPFKLKSGTYNGHTISDADMKVINYYLNDALKTTFVNIGPDETKVSHYDFCTYVDTIYLVWRNASSLPLANAEKFVEKFPVFMNDFQNKRSEILTQIERHLEHAGWLFSDVVNNVAWVGREDKPHSCLGLDNSQSYNTYLVHFSPPETEVLDIDGNKRSIFRVGIGTLNGIDWLSVTPEELGVHGVLEKLPLKVFIQKHAVDRVKERLGDVLAASIFFLVAGAVLDKDACNADGGNFLLACWYMSLKIGYFKADIIGDKLLIRTFLFLTNNGTPEGKKLASIIGVQKEDKKYLGIDKLSTFVNSDIEQDGNLKAIFCQAGCGDLFKIKKHLSEDKDHSMHCADYFTKYLGLRKEKGVTMME